VTLLLWCNPLRQQLNQGQINLVLLLLLTSTWAAWRSGRPWWAGVFLGTATALKLFPGFFFLFFLIRRQWSVVAAGAVAFAAWTAASAAVVGVDAYRGYVDRALPNVVEYRGSWLNDSVGGFWHRLFDPGTRHAPVQPIVRSPLIAKLATYASCAVLAGAMAWCVWRARSRGELDRAFGQTTTAMLLVSPVTWDHYFVMLLLPLVLLWRDLPRGGWQRPAFYILVGILWITPALFWWIGMRVSLGDWLGYTAVPSQSATAISIPFYALLGLFALDVATVRRGADGRKFAQTPRSTDERATQARTAGEQKHTTPRSSATADADPGRSPPPGPPTTTS
jgi:alpha-1,2-mannosyltransferase